MPRYLVAPLNWGLGHASRCIPIIKALQRRGHEVHLASDGAALQLLRAEFPELPIHQLPAWDIRYDTANMIWNIARQLPGLLYAIAAERRATTQLMHQYQFDTIISDNRYGCFHRKANSILLTHQLHLQLPAALKWPVQRLLKKAFSNFNALWVPDVDGRPNLAGALAHGTPMHAHTHYIGVLSRMQAGLRPVSIVYDMAIVLSGPEPQRTYFEQRLLEQVVALPYRCIVVQGQTHHKRHFFAAEHVEVVSYMTTVDLNQVLLSSKVVVCRSGYSSIMDLAVLGKQAILIPTPGQTEQEYLGNYFATEKVFLMQQQHKINIESALELVATTTTGFEQDLFDPNTFEQYL
jgi:UDP:flavonoid glycosyltransferase YjiC (YdhE family)